MPDATDAGLVSMLSGIDVPDNVKNALRTLGVRDSDRGFRDVRDLAGHSKDHQRLRALFQRLANYLPKCPDPGMVLVNLERFVSAAPDPSLRIDRLADDPRAIDIVLQLFSSSQYFSQLLIGDPELLDRLLGGTDRRDRDSLIRELMRELSDARADQDRRAVIRRYRRREMLRIGYDDVVRARPLEQITFDLSRLAETCVEAAYLIAREMIAKRYGEPIGLGGEPARFSVLALGKLGGEELNYSSDIDLIFLYDTDGMTSGRPAISNAEFFAKTGSEIIRLLSDHTDLGFAYRVDMRLRPEGERGPLARSFGATLGYYETAGRTWERQALIKARPVAADLELGRDFLEAIEPFVYRRYLGAAEIGEIKAMKRRIEQRTLSAGTSALEVKTGRGGIRDVEFVVQFLQLLHGGKYKDVRHGNTLSAIARLERIGCLTASERGIMEDTYRFLRRVEHRLQTMFDRQTHEMPADPEEQRGLAVRMGYLPESAWEARSGPTQRFLSDYRAKTELNRRILNHLLHDAFKDDMGIPADPIVDLVLDPSPAPEQIACTLERYPFRDRRLAYQNLMALAREDSPFLSQARCLHFLAAIAPRLLQAVGDAPDPDMALTNLEKVSASLGAKALLWELFNFNPPTLRLYVNLCSTSQFLSDILISNPGMIDDLIDSLVADRPEATSAIRSELADLCKGAEDLSAILLGFRNKEWLRIGTRDILGREPIREVSRELSDVAEAIVQEIAVRETSKLKSRRGAASTAEDRFAIVAFGKLGGCELIYHGDLDLVFLYDDDSGEFAAEATRRILRTLGGGSTTGALYETDTRLRPHGSAGELATSLASFKTYFEGPARTWERLALTKARVIHASTGFDTVVSKAIAQALRFPLVEERVASDVRTMRRKVEEAARPNDLKRGFGGILDIEFLVEFLQLVRLQARGGTVKANIWEALDALRDAGIIKPSAHASLTFSYEFLRTAESRLRLAMNRGVSELPNRVEELTGLALRMHYSGADPKAAFLADRERIAATNRGLLEDALGGGA